MIFHEHKNLVGLHSFLSPSQGSRFNYDEEKLLKTYSNIRNVERGTELHDIAQRIIQHNIDYPEEPIVMGNKGSSYNRYIDDATHYGLTPEVPLYFSPYCFGTADTIGYRNKFLRIHDLKTGEKPAGFEQLERYAALFLLEYGQELQIQPIDIRYELRIYQHGEAKTKQPDPEEIQRIMDYIVWASSVLENNFKMRGKANERIDISR